MKTELQKAILFYRDYVILSFFLGVVCFSCQSRKERIINQIEVPFELIRFDQKFRDTTNFSIETLKQQYPYLFHVSVSDSIWEAKRTDEWFLKHQSQVNQIYQQTNDIEKELRSLFQHIKYFFPKTQIPSKVIGLTNEVDYETKVVYLDSIVLIALDSFLGHENELYQGIHNYMRPFMSQEYLVSSVAKEIANKMVKPIQSRNFISKMIHRGKVLHVTETLLPKTPLKILFEYTDEQYQWAKQYEKLSWYYFIEKKLLYRTDMDLSKRFLHNAPYSKFYLEIDSDSSPRIGEYLGYQIVKSFIRKFPETTLGEIIEMKEEELFILSNYKPPR
ncbi:MAG: gliding motility lipoprotein GldB [Flavobacteriaceae bacterium]|nr:gliding motility lipoprotein GldB [Flavobacteriaceae bacterium]MCY4267418.1 gliding motility lipoprotein GldB [Flavobacteriaceae bacterium]